MTIHPTPPPTPQTWAGLEAEERLRRLELELAATKDRLRHQEDQLLRLAEEAARGAVTASTSTQTDILRLLGESGPLSGSELAAALGVSSKRVWWSTRQLHRRGLIHRVRVGKEHVWGLPGQVPQSDPRPRAVASALVSLGTWEAAVRVVEGADGPISHAQLAAALGISRVTAALIARAGEEAGVWQRYRQGRQTMIGTPPPPPPPKPARVTKTETRLAATLDLLGQREHSVTELARVLRVNRTVASRLINLLVEDGKVAKVGRARTVGNRAPLYGAVGANPAPHPDRLPDTEETVTPELLRQDPTVAQAAAGVGSYRGVGPGIWAALQVAPAPVSVRQLAAALAASVSCISGHLSRLQTSGHVRPVGSRPVCWEAVPGVEEPRFKSPAQTQIQHRDPVQREALQAQRKAIARLLTERAATTSEVSESVGLSLRVAQKRLDQLRRAGLVEPCGRRGKHRYYRAVGSQVEPPEVPNDPREITEDRWDEALDAILAYAYTHQEAMDRNLANPPQIFGPIRLNGDLMAKALEELAADGHLVHAGVIDGIPFYTTPTT